MNGAGTITLIGHANGYRMAPQVPISITGPTLKLTATPHEVAAGDTVTFTPTWSDGYAITIATNGWKWKPDTLPNLISQDGGDCTSSQTTCIKPMRQNGWMYVTVLRGGKRRTAKARVTVVPRCQTGDPILDSPAVQQVLRQLWKHSNPDDGITNNRREQAAVIYRNPTTGEYSAMEWPNPTYNTPCRSGPGNPAVSPAPPMEWIVAQVHTHPFHAFDGLPYNCTGKLDPGQWAFYDPVTNGGPSKADWEQIDSFRAWDANFTDRKIPEYVIDQDYIYKGNPDTPKQDRLLHTPTWGRNNTTLGCQLP